jgi:predicted DNA-binding transcriptional regulator YafY
MPTETKIHRFFRLILFLSNSYPKTKEDCIQFLEIGDTAFYSYCNTLKDTGFNLHQKDGKYWIDFPDQDFQVLRNVLHFSEEEMYLLSRSIELIEEKQVCATRLKQKLASFLNREKTIEIYRQETLLSWEYERLHRSKPVDIFRNTGDLNKQIEFSLNLKAKNLLIEEYPLSERFLTKIGNNQFVLKAPVAKYEGPGRFVLGLADDIQIIGNEDFRDYLKTKISKYQHLF